MSVATRLRTAVGLSALAVLVAARGDVRAVGQQPEPAPSIKRVSLTAGRSTVISTDFDISRIAVTNPAVADAVVVQPREVLIDGKSSGSESQQVILQVRFAEVNRRALMELGSTFFTSRTDMAGRSTTQQFASPDFKKGEKPEDAYDYVFNDFLNLFFVHRGVNGGFGAL